MSDILLEVYPDLRFIYRGHTLLITNRNGNIEQGLQGLYEHDVRLLSRYQLLVNDAAPRPVSLSAVDSYSSLGYYVAPPARDAALEMDALGLPQEELDRQVVIRIARFVGRGLHEDVEVTNHGQSEARLEITWVVDADFADLLEVRGGQRQQQAPVESRWQATTDGEGHLRLDYRHPDLSVGALYRFRAATAGRASTALYERRDGERVSFVLHLRPQESAQYCFEIAPVMHGQVMEPLYTCDSFHRRPPGEWNMRATRLYTGNPVVQKAWNRATADLGALALGDGNTQVEMAVPAAGIPLYGTLFGRDALTTAG